MKNNIQWRFKSLILSALALIIMIPAMAQGLVVKGVIVDKSGTPILGATALIQGTTVGTTTDLDG